MPTTTRIFELASSRKANSLLSNRKNRCCSRRLHCNCWRLWWIWITDRVRCRSRVTSNASHWNWRSGPAVDSESHQQVNQKRPVETGLFLFPSEVLLDLQNLESELTIRGLCF